MNKYHPLKEKKAQVMESIRPTKLFMVVPQYGRILIAKISKRYPSELRACSVFVRSRDADTEALSPLVSQVKVLGCFTVSASPSPVESREYYEVAFTFFGGKYQ